LHTKYWQHIGNKKSDTQYPMDNTDNRDIKSQIIYTKMFKSRFWGPSGSNTLQYFEKCWMVSNGLKQQAFRRMPAVSCYQR
jgi:hypothetical protein